jgi:ATP-dependent DNA ligase
MQSLRCFPTLLFPSWGGYNWTDRYLWIVEAPRKVRQKRFMLDGEAVVLGVDGISDFNALHKGTV